MKNTMNIHGPWIDFKHKIKLDSFVTIQTIPYNFLFITRQNAPITSIDTEVVLN